MKQRADERAAKFPRPKFIQMIQWQFDVHAFFYHTTEILAIQVCWGLCQPPFI